jgi:ABC-type branched-subunit amino acid transport system substrate-binding protein
VKLLIHLITPDNSPYQAVKTYISLVGNEASYFADTSYDAVLS